MALNTTSDVVIIGAGLSGLTAAYTLRKAQKHLQITVVEGRNRIGGRLHSLDGLDVGGAWCWPDYHTTLATFANRLGVQSFSQRVGSRVDDTRIRFKGGAVAICDALFAQTQNLDVQLCCKVTAIRQTADSAQVDTLELKSQKKSTITCKRVILAVPPQHVLAISFLPPLPDVQVKTIKAQPTWMAAFSKVLLTYKKPFWRQNGRFREAGLPNGPINQLYDSCSIDDSTIALCGFVPLSLEVACRSDNKDGIVAAVVKQLTALLGEQASKPLNVKWHSWYSDEWTCLESEPNFQHPRYARFAGVAQGRIHFAGTEFSRKETGLMEGAVICGKDTASAVLKEL